MGGSKLLRPTYQRQSLLQSMKDLFWTAHAKAKMEYYRLSESRVRRVIKNPERIEQGIADDTIALMQPHGRGKSAHEIWVMIFDAEDKRRVISAWRYPGKTLPGEALPSQIMKEFEEASSYI